MFRSRHRSLAGSLESFHQRGEGVEVAERQARSIEVIVEDFTAEALFES